MLASARGGGGCLVQVVWNGLTLYNGTPGQETFDIDTVLTTDIIGIEYYIGLTTPEEFVGRGSACGTIMIWTRNG